MRECDAFFSSAIFVLRLCFIGYPRFLRLYPMPLLLRDQIYLVTLSNSVCHLSQLKKQSAPVYRITTALYCRECRLEAALTNQKRRIFCRKVAAETSVDDSEPRQQQRRTPAASKRSGRLAVKKAHESTKPFVTLDGTTLAAKNYRGFCSFLTFDHRANTNSPPTAG